MVSPGNPGSSVLRQVAVPSQRPEEAEGITRYAGPPRPRPIAEAGPAPADIATAVYRHRRPPGGTSRPLPVSPGRSADHLFAIEQGYAKITSESPTATRSSWRFSAPSYTIGVAGLHTPAIYNFNAVAADALVVSPGRAPRRAS